MPSRRRRTPPSVLQNDGFGDAQTVERVLVDKQMQAKMRAGVILVDESGLLSVKDAKRLFDLAKEQDARILLVGDSGQHKAVERGDALRILEQSAAVRVASLKEIRRQTNEDYRKAVKAISEGDALGQNGRTRLQEGIEALDKMGSIVEDCSEDRYRRIARDYADVISQRRWNPKAGGWQNKSSLVVSPTHREADNVTQAIRQVLKESGKLSAKEREFITLRPLNLTRSGALGLRQLPDGRGCAVPPERQGLHARRARHGQKRRSYGREGRARGWV